MMRVQYEIGRYKTWLGRLQSYLGPLNFVMILYLYIKEEPMGIIWQAWAVILSVFLVVILFIDVVFIYPSESRYISRKNPEWCELRDEIVEIRKLIINRNGDQH